MKIPYQSPPQKLRSLLGDDAYTYFEHLHGLVMGIGSGDPVGRLDIQNLGILSGKEGQLVTVDTDGRRARLVEPLIEDVMRAKSSGFLTADEEGNVTTTRVEFPTQQTATPPQPSGEMVIEPPTGGLVVGGDTDSRRYALFVSWV